jgi:hypothetical protein
MCLCQSIQREGRSGHWFSFKFKWGREAAVENTLHTLPCSLFGWTPYPTCEVTEPISFTGKQIMEGWALYDLEYITLRNLCKSNTHVQKYIIAADGTPNASGHSNEDIVRLLLDGMCMELKGKPSMGEADLSDHESEVNDGTEANNQNNAEDGKPPFS